jgi:hypothetical protein
VRTSVRIPRGTREIVCVPVCPLRTWTGFLREPLRATLATVEAPVVCAVPIAAPLPLLYATNQVQVTTHNHIMQRVPWEWEVSADLFIRGVADADKGRTASAEECRQAQRSDSSPGRFMI